MFGWSLNLSRIMNTTLRHSHVTFTIPGKLSRLLFDRKYDTLQMIPLAAEIYKSYLRSTARVKEKHIQPGILATLHKSGNSLNFNPHVHLIGTNELVDTKSGEIIKIDFLPYKEICYIWKKAFLKHLLKQNVITAQEYVMFNDSYKNGFHVCFQAISGTENEVLFRTAEYIATGYFHNTRITEVDNNEKTITFRYKKFMHRHIGKKYYAAKTMDIYEFMARMLFFLPEKNKKMIRYYGIYASNVEKKIKGCFIPYS